MAHDIYVVEPPQTIGGNLGYTNGQIIAQLAFGQFSNSATIIAGTVPPNVSFNTTSGVFIVVTNSLLVAGLYPMTIVTNRDGHDTTHNIVIELGIPATINVETEGKTFSVDTDIPITFWALVSGNGVADFVMPNGSVNVTANVPPFNNTQFQNNSVTRFLDYTTELEVTLNGTNSYTVTDDPLTWFYVEVRIEYTGVLDHDFSININGGQGLPDPPNPVVRIFPFSLKYDPSAFVNGITAPNTPNLNVASGFTGEHSHFPQITGTGFTSDTLTQKGLAYCVETNIKETVGNNAHLETTETNEYEIRIPTGVEWKTKLLATNNGGFYSVDYWISNKSFTKNLSFFKAKFNETIVVEVEAIYTVSQAKPVGTYSNGDVLATVTDANGAIVSSVIDVGFIPNGAVFNTTTGEITVSDSTVMVVGVYPLTITTTDIEGGTTIHNINIEFLTSVAKADFTAQELICFGTVFQKCFGASKGETQRINLPSIDPKCGCNPDEYFIPVFAESPTKTSSELNDLSSFFFETGLDDDVVVYELEKFECGVWTSKQIITDSSLGLWNDKGFNSAMENMTTLTIEWFNVLSSYSFGKYRIKTDVNASDVFYSHIYELKVYNESNAFGTVRFDWDMTGKWGADNGTELFDFGTQSVPNSIRVQGQFGFKTVDYEKTEVQYQTGLIKRTREEKIKNYTFESGLIANTVHDVLSDFAFLSDTLKVSDFNAINNSPNIANLPIGINSNYAPTYYSGIDKSRVEVQFQLRTQNGYRKLC